MHFLEWNCINLIKISPKIVSKGPIKFLAVIQIIDWRRPGDKPLSESMMVRLLTHICVTQPQWGKVMHTARHYGLWWKVLYLWIYPTAVFHSNALCTLLMITHSVPIMIWFRTHTKHIYHQQFPKIWFELMLMYTETYTVTLLVSHKNE